MEFVKKYKVPLAVVAVVLMAGLGWLIYASWQNGIMNEGRERQRDIVTLERDIEIELSNCLDTGATAAQVAQEEFEAVESVLVNVAAARYTSPDGDPTRADAALGGAPFISALSEQYPEIDTTTWQRLMDVVIGCRQDVADAQSRLQHFAGEFDKWRTTGGVFARNVRDNFPNDELYTIDRQTGARLTGMAALEYLQRVISVEAAQDAMRDGTLPDQDLFGNDDQPAPTPAPTPTQ